jgi:hypothetical protein
MSGSALSQPESPSARAWRGFKKNRLAMISLVFLLVGSLGALITVLFLAPLSQAAIVLRRFALRYFLCIPQAKTFSVEDAYHDPRAATPTKVTAKHMM